MARISTSLNRLGQGLFAATLVASSAFGQSPDSSVPTPIASTRPDRDTTVAPTTPINAARAVAASIKVDGVVSPGLRVTLDASGSSGGRVWYRWLQTQGTTVEIENNSKAQASFVVPPESSPLGFVLVVGNATGVDAQTVTLPVEDAESLGHAKTLRADAGDEQVTRVGKKVVLNGIRSEPRGKIHFRWIQTSGPKVQLKGAETSSPQFVPGVAGIYQFVLVVSGADGELAEPSPVTVNVNTASGASVETPGIATDELARVSIASIEGGSKYAEDISKAFDSIADRIDSFKTFSDAISEMTKRLDAIVPRDKERRATWIDRFFSPIMAQLLAGLKTEGLDLNKADSRTQPMSRNQKAKLAEELRYTAAGLRASSVLR